MQQFFPMLKLSKLSLLFVNANVRIKLRMSNVRLTHKLTFAQCLKPVCSNSMHMTLTIVKKPQENEEKLKFHYLPSVPTYQFTCPFSFRKRMRLGNDKKDKKQTEKNSFHSHKSVRSMESVALNLSHFRVENLNEQRFAPLWGGGGKAVSYQRETHSSSAFR